MSRGRGGRPPSNRNPESRAADQRQLADAPVSLRRIGRLFEPHRARLVLVVVLIVTSSLIALAQPFLIKRVIDVAIPQQDVTLLVTCVLLMVGIAVATSAIGVVQTWQSTTVGQRVMHRLRSDLFGHLQRQSIGFFTRTRGGEIQSRVVNDIGSMQSVVTSTATSIAANVTTVVGTLVAMLLLSWQLALVTLVVLPPAVILTRQVARMRYAVTAARQRKLADLHVQVEEGLSISGIQLTKTLGAAPTLARRFEQTSAELVDLEVRSQLAGRWRMATMNIVFAAVPAALYLAAGLPATSGRDDDRHLGRLRGAPGRALPAPDGTARRPGRRHRVAGALQPDLRVPGPAGRDRRPRRPDPARPRAWRGQLRPRRLRVRRRSWCCTTST